MASGGGHIVVRGGGAGLLWEVVSIHFFFIEGGFGK